MYSSLICRIVFRKWYSLKTPNHLRQDEVQMLHNVFKQPPYEHKLQYLRNLPSDKLQSYYQSKTINTLEDEELYFLMNSNISYNISRQGQQEVINKVNSVYFKCLLYKEFGWFKQNQQYLIVLRFNEELHELTLSEIIFCLEVIQNFQTAIQALDKTLILNKIENYVDKHQNAHQMLLINGYLSQMFRIPKRILSQQSLKNWIIYNKTWDFRAIYFVYKLTEHLNIILSPQVKQKVDELMKTTINSLKFNKFDTNYLAFMLKYYPEHVHKLNILHFSARAYIDYLNFLKDHPEAIVQHKIPASVLQLSPSRMFSKILQLRLELKLDNSLSIAKNLSDYFVNSLNPVIIYLKHLSENLEQITTEAQYLIEKLIKNKLKLYDFKPETLQQYELKGIITIFMRLGKMEMCSVQFWRLAVFWLEELISYNQKYNIINHSQGIYANILYLVVKKNFKESTRRIVYDKIISMLQHDEYWPLTKLSNIVSVLSFNRIGQHKLWLLIERRFFSFFTKQGNTRLSHKTVDLNQSSIYRMANNFNVMEKGSYEFWQMMNSILNDEFKKLILQKSKGSDSLAHLHLKISS